MARPASITRSSWHCHKPTTIRARASAENFCPLGILGHWSLLGRRIERTHHFSNNERHKMSKVIAAQIKNILKNDGFIPHKKNAKGSTVIYSRNHPTAKFVRVVVNSGIDAKSGKFTAQPTVKLCYINRKKSWREITTEIFTDPKKLASTIKAQEAAEKFVASCKHCKAKKFKAKTGNVVCANACWTAWGGKKKSASPKSTEETRHKARHIQGSKISSESYTKKSEELSSQQIFSEKGTEKSSEILSRNPPRRSGHD